MTTRHRQFHNHQSVKKHALPSALSSMPNRMLPSPGTLHHIINQPAHPFVIMPSVGDLTALPPSAATAAATSAPLATDPAGEALPIATPAPPPPPGPRSCCCSACGAANAAAALPLLPGRALCALALSATLPRGVPAADASGREGVPQPGEPRPLCLSERAPERAWLKPRLLEEWIPRTSRVVSSWVGIEQEGKVRDMQGGKSGKGGV